MGRTTSTKKRKKKAAQTRRPFDLGPRKKGCPFCKADVEQIDYKQFDTLRQFMSERGKIRTSRITGVCRRHQTQLTQAIKRSRQMARLPYLER